MDDIESQLDLEPLHDLLAEFIPRGRTALLPALQAAQAHYGYLPARVAAEIGNALGVPLAEVFGVIDFYSLLYSQPVGKTVVHVCNDPACSLAGSDSLFKVISQRAEKQAAQQGQSRITVELAPCLGLCELAPAALVNEIQIGHADPSRIYEAGYPQSVRPRNIVGGDIRLLTANCGKGRTTTLQEYESAGGYRALRRILGNNGMLPMSPQDVVQEIKNAGLIGRGGAAFPTGLKWEGAATATDFPKYVVCNGDEAEPGTFKDRVMMEEDPHRVLEGLIIAGYAIGANHGYIFIRGEYPHAFEMMKRAIEEGHRAGLLGENILGSSFTFDVELRRGAGAYICGEETALFEAIEGKRGFPRSKPPYPTTYGLFGKPTVINNVETLANVPLILQMGSEAYRKIGTQKSPGPKLFCVSGDVRRPGLYEVPFGVPLRHLIEDLAGGIREGHQLQAMLIGGAAGTFAGPQHLDVSTSFEDLRAAGLAMGSGVITVFDETRDLRNVLIRLARFFAEESCGKCFPCQLGTQRQYEIIERLADGKPLPGDIERLNDVGWTMTDASLCGLGQTAASAVLSALKLFPELFTFGKE